MPIKPLPTGEEPPKGYESLVGLGVEDDAVRVNCVILSQLASIELAEIENMRAEALDSIKNLVGLTSESLSFEHETNILPNVSPSDKMLFRAYKGKALAGYALVVNGWPQPCSWVIQHMIINPSYRLQGVGTTIVAAIERYAQSSEVATTSIFAIPIEKSGLNFWGLAGYTVETSRHPIKVDNLDHELVVYRKEL
jgi:GNAT superfamily N-acetyltransferase